MLTREIINSILYTKFIFYNFVLSMIGSDALVNFCFHYNVKALQFIVWQVKFSKEFMCAQIHISNLPINFSYSIWIKNSLA